MVAADFTGDGKVDLLTSNQYIQDDQKCSGNGSFRVFPGNGDGTFRSPLPCSPETGQGDWGTRNIAVADLNGDGKLDVVWGNVRSSPVIIAWLGNGDGTFGKSIVIDAGTGQGAKPLAIADVNHDGIPDIVVAAHFFEVTVLLGNGDGTFRKKLRTSDVMLVCRLPIIR